MRAARRISCVAVRGAGERDDDPLARLPRPVDAVRAPVVLRAPRRPGRRPRAARARAARRGCRPEVVAERGVDPFGGVDVAVRHPAPQRLGRHVDQLDLVGAAHDLVRDRLALRDAGDPLDDVVERLEVLDVDGGDDVDAGVEELLDVLPALLVARARARWCARARRRARPSGRRARTASTSISSNVAPRYSIVPARNDLEVADLLRGAAAGRASRRSRRRRRCRARCAGDPRRAWRTSCRRRARRRGRCGACPRAMARVDLTRDRRGRG